MDIQEFRRISVDIDKVSGAWPSLDMEVDGGHGKIEIVDLLNYCDTGTTNTTCVHKSTIYNSLDNRLRGLLED